MLEEKRIYEEILVVDRTNVEVWVMLGIINRRLCNFEDAERCCRKALMLQPNYAPAHLAMGASLQQQGRLEQAISCYQQAIQLQPDYVDAHYYLANALSEHGLLEDAEAAYQTLLNIKPNHVEALNNLGALLKHTGNPKAAIEVLQRALRERPNTVELLTNLGKAYAQVGLLDEATETLYKAIAIRPDYFEAHRIYSQVLLSRGRFKEALASSENALKLRPDAANIRIQQAHILEVQGEYEKAFSLLQPLLEAGIDDAVPTFFDISRHVGKREKAIELMQKALTRNSLPRAIASSIHFRSGKHFDEEGDFDRAFEHYQSANQLCAKRFDIEPVASWFDAIIKIYTPEFVRTMEHATNRSERPVFIIGMPRSGTSLVEQILASHPSVYGAGELPDIDRAVSRLTLRYAGLEYPGFVHHLRQPTLDHVAESYLDTLNKLSGSMPRITDKMPHNFLYLGLIAQLFPAARIIHCIRNPLDTCLSCFFADFGNVLHDYAYDLVTLGRYYALYRTLMEHWHKVLGDQVLKISYAGLVQEQEVVIRKMVEFCNLKWDERCLDFYKSDRVAYTLSYDQVRQPIYSRSVDRWKHYERHLDALREVLA